jgi:hypothetical protein
VSVSQTALWWARVRATGPVPVPPATGAGDGLTRLVEPDGTAIWLVAVPPETAGGGALAELGLAGPPVEQPNDTARLLAAVVRCCWTDPHAPVWPGAQAPWSSVLSVFHDYADRDERAFARAATGAVRRLHSAGWVLWDERARRVRLGPRVAAWSPADLTVLREMCRQMPEPSVPPAELTGPTGKDDE